MAIHGRGCLSGSSFQETRHHLELLAAQNGGRWSGSGVGQHPGIAERDIEFQFDQEDSAREFSQACEKVPGIRILSLTEDDP